MQFVLDGMNPPSVAPSRLCLLVERFDVDPGDEGEAGVEFGEAIRESGDGLQLTFGEELGDGLEAFAEEHDIGGGKAEGEHLGHLGGIMAGVAGEELIMEELREGVAEPAVRRGPELDEGHDLGGGGGDDTGVGERFWAFLGEEVSGG